MMIKQWLRRSRNKGVARSVLSTHSHPDVIIGNLSSSTVQQREKLERFILVSHRKDLICNDRCVVPRVGWYDDTFTDFEKSLIEPIEMREAHQQEIRIVWAYI